MELKMGRIAILATLLALACVNAAAADASFDFRLSPGPRLVGTRADSSGSGRVAAQLTGSTLSLTGSYQGLLGAPTSAQLLMGPAPGVRGPKISDLTISAAPNGNVSGSVKLNTAQLAAFRKGGLYVEIDSTEAPEGDLWGWVMPPSQ
jgi:hypothetical protein